MLRRFILHNNNTYITNTVSS